MANIATGISLAKSSADTEQLEDVSQAITLFENIIRGIWLEQKRAEDPWPRCCTQLIKLFVWGAHTMTYFLLRQHDNALQYGRRFVVALNKPKFQHCFAGLPTVMILALEPLMELDARELVDRLLNVVEKVWGHVYPIITQMIARCRQTTRLRDESTEGGPSAGGDGRDDAHPPPGAGGDDDGRNSATNNADRSMGVDDVGGGTGAGNTPAMFMFGMGGCDEHGQCNNNQEMMFSITCSLMA